MPSTPPFPDGGSREAHLFSDMGLRGARLDAFDKDLPARWGQTGITVRHRDSEVVVRIVSATSTLPRSLTQSHHQLPTTSVDTTSGSVLRLGVDVELVYQHLDLVYSEIGGQENQLAIAAKHMLDLGTGTQGLDQSVDRFRLPMGRLIIK